MESSALRDVFPDSQSPLDCSWGLHHQPDPPRYRARCARRWSPNSTGSELDLTQLKASSQHEPHTARVHTTTSASSLSARAYSALTLSECLSLPTPEEFVVECVSIESQHAPSSGTHTRLRAAANTHSTGHSYGSSLLLVVRVLLDSCCALGPCVF